ncbi:MAG: DUF4157 domain-containing protein [Rhizonema sp. PD37]|nr:DUF4157 domain-containing protein [Rhizonema sp. PD37]
MVKERVQKSFGQSSSKKKPSPIVPPLNEELTQAVSQSSPKEKLSRIPSKEERDAIRRSLFEKWSNVPQSSIVDVRTHIQAKLTIGASGDKYEQEADRVAAQVVNQINTPASQQPNQNLQREQMFEEDELQMKSETETLQREDMPEEGLQMKPMLQLQAGEDGIAATPDLESSIQQARGGGKPLADNIRKPMEQAFRADFSKVKIHTDAQSDLLNQSIQARAFTTGQNVFFRQGEYQPGTRGGQELIAHELTHVVQQNGYRKEADLMTEKAEVTEFANGSAQTCSSIQRYRADNAPPATDREQELKMQAILACTAIHLPTNKFFYHVTTVNNMTKIGGILASMNLNAQRGKGASQALGGETGADLLAQSLGFSYATRDPETASEYFELHLSKARMAKNYGLSPVIIIVKLRTYWDLEPDPDEAPGAAVRTPRGFLLHSILSSPKIQIADIE